MRRFTEALLVLLLCGISGSANAGPGSVAVYSNQCRDPATGHVQGFRLAIVDEGGREVSVIYSKSSTKLEMWPLHYGEWKDFRKGKLEVAVDRDAYKLQIHGTVTDDVIVLAPHGIRLKGVSELGDQSVRLPRVTLPEHDPDCQPGATRP